jgi:ABC-type spermidine/putrescine transport system permease subunit I
MLIQQQITLLKWGFGAALALVLLILALGIYALFTRVLGVERVFGSART